MVDPIFSANGDGGMRQSRSVFFLLIVMGSFLRNRACSRGCDLQMVHLYPFVDMKLCHFGLDTHCQGCAYQELYVVGHIPCITHYVGFLRYGYQREATLKPVIPGVWLLVAFPGFG